LERNDNYSEKEERQKRQEQTQSRLPRYTSNEYEVEISQMSENGEGQAVKGFWVFVPNVKFGEKIKVRIKYVDSVSADAEVISRS